MIVVLETKSGKLIEEEIDREMSLAEAKVRYDTQLIRVIEVKNISTGNLSNYEACQIIANKGIGYAVQRYISADKFKDPKTVELWIKADIALDNLLEHLDYENFEG